MSSSLYAAEFDDFASEPYDTLTDEEAVWEEFEDEFSDSAKNEGIDYSVIGPRDDRFQVRARDRAPSTRLFPYSTICFLETPAGSGTGTLIAPQVVLTAKHVVSSARPPCASSAVAGTSVTSVRVTPGADFSAGNAALRRPGRPGSVVVPRSRIRLHPTLDIAVAVLPRPVANPARFMLLQPRGDVNTSTLLTVAGYPCDKPRGTMWAHSDRVRIANVTATHLRYRMDTCPGHSGSPIWLLGAGQTRILLGVHTTGAGGSASRCPSLAGVECARNGAPVQTATGLNCGVRVHCQVIRFITSVCRAFRVRPPSIDQVQMRRACS